MKKNLVAFTILSLFILSETSLNADEVAKGALTGGILGAVIGGATHGGTGAAIGGAAGLGAGVIIGSIWRSNKQYRSQRHPDYKRHYYPQEYPEPSAE